MMPVAFDPADLSSVLPPGGLTLVSGCAAESGLLADAIAAAGPRLGPMTFSGIFVPGLNRRTYLANSECRILTFFMTPELKALGEAVEFLPLCYQDVLRELRRRKPQAALFMCAPPDEAGRCSFGVQVDFLAELWPEIPVRIAHINPAMPRTQGDPGIPYDELTAFYVAEQPLLTGSRDLADPVAGAIAERIQPFIGNGATLQVGIGKIPGALLRSLTGRRDLKLHSGLACHAVLDLIKAGAMAPGLSATVGAAIGGPELYNAASGSPFQFRPVSVTHGAAVLAAIDDFVGINSALQVDLLGQAYSELMPQGLISGPGGAPDFARGARLGNGLRIIALPSTAGPREESRIVAPGQGAGPVTLGRMDIDLVVTEHGIADLRGRDYDERARALVAVASPSRRAELRETWRSYRNRL